MAITTRSSTIVKPRIDAVFYLSKAKMRQSGRSFTAAPCAQRHSD